MAQYKGRDFLLKIKTGVSTYTTIGGVKDTQLTINNSVVDATHKGSAGVRTLLAQAGINSMQISASGLFDNDAAIDVMEPLAHSGDAEVYQIVAGNGDTYQGSFIVSSFSRSGSLDGVEQFSVTLESSGAVTFTAGS